MVSAAGGSNPRTLEGLARASHKEGLLGGTVRSRVQPGKGQSWIWRGDGLSDSMGGARVQGLRLLSDSCSGSPAAGTNSNSFL